MPIRKIRLPNGQVLPIRSDRDLTDDELRQRAMQYMDEKGIEYKKPDAPEEPTPKTEVSDTKTDLTLGEKAVGVGELGLTMGTGAIAEVLAGLGGIRTAIQTGDLNKANQTIKQIQESLTYQPRGEGAKRMGAAIGEVVEPVVEGYREHVADPIAETLGPAAGAAAMTAPAAALELAGLKGTGTLRRLGKTAERVGDVVDDAIPPTVPTTPVTQKALTQEAKRIGGQAGKLSEQRALSGMAKGIEPNPDVAEAVQALNMSDDVTASILTDNPMFSAVESGLESVSPKIPEKKVGMLKRLGEEADQTITMLGGVTDKSQLSTNFKNASTRLVERLEKEADTGFKSLSEKIGTKTPVKARNTLKYFQQRADDIGEANLTRYEKRLIEQLSPENKPTYGQLDFIRKQIGRGYKNKGPFKDAERADLDALYGPIAEDQLIAARGKGHGGEYKLSNTNVVVRKSIEEKLLGLIGRDIKGDIAKKAGQAIKNLGKGHTRDWDNLVTNIPHQIDKKLRREIIVSSLNDAFTGSTLPGQTINVKNFNNFMQGLKRNPSAALKLKSELGDEGWTRLNNLGTVSNAIVKAQQRSKVKVSPKVVDKGKSIGGRLFGLGKAIPGVGLSARLLKGAISGDFSNLLSATPRSVKAAELIADTRFTNLLIQKATNRLDSADKLKRAEDMLEGMSAYQAWKSTLDKGELADLMAVGGLGYILGEEFKPKE